MLLPAGRSASHAPALTPLMFMPCLTRACCRRAALRTSGCWSSNQQSRRRRFSSCAQRLKRMPGVVHCSGTRIRTGPVSMWGYSASAYRRRPSTSAAMRSARASGVPACTSLTMLALRQSASTTTPYCGGASCGQRAARSSARWQTHHSEQLCRPQEAVAALVAVQHRVEDAGQLCWVESARGQTHAASATRTMNEIVVDPTEPTKPSTRPTGAVVSTDDAGRAGAARTVVYEERDGKRAREDRSRDEAPADGVSRAQREPVTLLTIAQWPSRLPRLPPRARLRRLAAGARADAPRLAPPDSQGSACA